MADYKALDDASNAITTNAKTRTENIDQAIGHATVVKNIAPKVFKLYITGNSFIGLAIFIAFATAASGGNEYVGMASGSAAGLGLIMWGVAYGIERHYEPKMAAAKGGFEIHLAAIAAKKYDASKTITVLHYPDVTPQQEAQVRALTHRANDECSVCTEKTDSFDAKTVYTLVKTPSGETERLDFSGPYHETCLKQVEQKAGNGADAKDQKQALRDPKTRAGAKISDDSKQTVALSPRQTHFRLFHLHPKHRLAPATGSGGAAAGPATAPDAQRLQPFLNTDVKVDVGSNSGTSAGATLVDMSQVEGETDHANPLIQSLLSGPIR